MQIECILQNLKGVDSEAAVIIKEHVDPLFKGHSKWKKKWERIRWGLAKVNSNRLDVKMLLFLDWVVIEIFSMASQSIL